MTHACAGRLALLLGSTVLGTGIVHAQSVPIPAGPAASGAAIGESSPSSSAAPSALSDQQVTPTASAASRASAQDIVVTGSRIVANGYKAPTPVTVVSTTELLKKAPESIAAGLNTLPQFKASSGANVTSSQARTPSAGNYLNLRSLGTIETLTLLDGQRLPPTSYEGTVDANIIPQALVQRVDVVTGGASAAYGADAVAGVVNFILDKTFEGVKGSIQYGKSSRWDDHQVKASVAAGKSFLDNRLHLEGSFDYFFQPGIANNGERPYGGNYYGGWVNVGAYPAGTGTNTVANGCPVSGCAAGTRQNPYTPTFNVRLANGSYGTLVNSARNAAGQTVPFTLNGTTFDPNGAFHKADLGTPTGTPNFNVGGKDTAVSFGTTLTSYVKTKQGFARADYDFDGGVKAFLQGSYTETDTQFVTVAAGTQFQSFQIFADNAYLPTAFRDAMLAQGVNSFVGSRVEADQTPKRAYDNNKATTILGGFNGDIGKFRWNVSGSYGSSDLHVRHTGNFQQQRWFAALDAVRGPQGNIVCRITVTNPGLQDNCVPWNLFGNGSPSQASYNYFQEDSKFRVKSEQYDGAANISGPLFDLPAGSVNIAAGAEIRRQTLKVTSNNDPAVPIDLTGLRTYVTPYNLTYNSTNQGKANGKQTVKEAFVELAVPVLRDVPFFESFDLNASGRYADYSVSGGIWAWKGGASWVPTHQLRFRGTYSQDIRAPTLYELFAGTSSTRGTFNDVHTNTNTNLISLTQGNPNLKPEIARTFTVGVIWQPTFLPNFSASLDYYHIKIKDQISTLGTTDINQRCEDSGGNDPLCQYVVRPLPFSDRTAANFPTTISSIPFNQASLVTHGFDYELNYRVPMSHVFNDDPSRIDLRFIGNYTPSLITKSGPTAVPVQLAGVANNTASTAGGVPRHKFSASAQFTEGPLSFGFDVRFIGVQHYSKVATQFYTNNRIPSVAYLNANISYDLTVRGHQVTLFATGTNLTDKFVFAPQANAQPTEFYPTFQSSYDVVGAYFVAGLRFKL